MKPEYEPKSREQKVGYLVEEAGEMLSALGKLIRWGPESTNPELPEAERETNRDWLFRELDDLHGAIDRIRVEFCRTCDGSGIVHVVAGEVTREMAIDAETPELEGQPVHVNEACPDCAAYR